MIPDSDIVLVNLWCCELPRVLVFDDDRSKRWRCLGMSRRLQFHPFPRTARKYLLLARVGNFCHGPVTAPQTQSWYELGGSQLRCSMVRPDLLPVKLRAEFGSGDEPDSSCEHRGRRHFNPAQKTASKSEKRVGRGLAAGGCC